MYMILTHACVDNVTWGWWLAPVLYILQLVAAWLGFHTEGGKQTLTNNRLRFWAPSSVSKQSQAANQSQHV